MQKILIVDDEPGIREILNRFLTKSGYQVVTASCGRDAIDILNASEKAVDFLIIDMKMPELKGIDVLQRVSQSYSKMPFILLSGSLELESYVDKIKAFGFTKFNIGSKPIMLNDLLVMIQKLLPKEA